ncbi:MAG TPA: copper homeostasis membrane protein CopD [Casimicrobiaceae bacterium]|nr:copper homeostasis membrane protein CopD [Casimicrobiaceae bacterium]
MNALFVTVRAVHFASAMLLFGELVFVLCVAKPMWRSAGNAILDENDVSRWPVRIAVWGLLASIASGVAWLAIEAAVMSGMPLEQALNRTTVALVLGETLFGRVWLLRAAVGVGLGALLTAIVMARDDGRRSRLTMGAAVLAGVYLATLAWAGHAAAGPPEERSLHLTSDVVHLLAAGAWLGALPGLAFLLGRARGMPNVPSFDTAEMTRRFSALGVVSVGALLLSGLANTWYLVGDVPALLGTDYGRLLLAKLALFAAMITLALVNRLRLTPRLYAHDRAALHGLRRNALLEAATGLLIVTLVGLLGITVPAAHQAPVWPFAYTLSLEPVYESVGISTVLVFAASAALVAAGMALRGFRTRRPALWLSGLAGICVAASSSAWLLAVPAHPTSYLTSPVRYTTTSIVSGSARYVRACSACHDSHGPGDRRAAASLALKPANLIEYASHHRAGDVFWVIARGIPGTPMSAFAPQLTDSEIWQLIQFLRAQSEATDARALTHRVEPWLPIVAPDFTFEIDAQPQESLRKQRGRFVTQLVFYTLPDSLPRLRQLATEERRFAEAGVRVIAVPLVISSTSAEADTVNHGKSIFAITRPDVALAYAMFARRSIESGDDAPAHVEFLIDRQGYLRARWIGVPAAATDRTAEILSQIKQLDDERARVPPPAGHAH